VELEGTCRHFGECGGCRLQDLSYEEQLAKKTEVLNMILERSGWQGTAHVHPSPQKWYYRNKMEFSFQDVHPRPEEGEDHLLLGLKVRNRWDRVMNLEECRLMSEDAVKLIESVHSWARKESLEPYNLHKHEGFLRHLVVREAKNTDERLVNLVTAPGDLPKESFIKAVHDVYPTATILHAVHDGRSDIAVGEKLDVLHGAGVFHEKLLGKSFRISPYAFFQTNTRGAEFLYSRIRESIEGLEISNLLDLYCGSGGIGLCLADLCGRVMGVESVESAIEDARHNAQLNGIENADFMAAKVEDILPGLAAQKIDVDVIVTDPPRSGLHPTAVNALKEMAPPWIVYVSCNPKALGEDVRRLSELYDLRKVEGVDLFPHTDHMEALALFQRIY